MSCPPVNSPSPPQVTDTSFFWLSLVWRWFWGEKEEDVDVHKYTSAIRCLSAAFFIDKGTGVEIQHPINELYRNGWKPETASNELDAPPAHHWHSRDLPFHKKATLLAMSICSLLTYLARAAVVSSGWPEEGVALVVRELSGKQDSWKLVRVFYSSLCPPFLAFFAKLMSCYYNIFE